ncbi:MAG: hypothetical protein J6Y03_05760 [Alphaproteobacteria bacterium]|nr:hypothetical protein [Alphaproteobacteria bacterium]
MKKIFFLAILLSLTSTFHANAVDVFALPTNEKTFYEKGFPLNEYLIYTPDKKCFLHYLSIKSLSMYKNIQINQLSPSENDQCLEKGFASVNITDDKNNLIQTLTGYFLNGFFIGSVPLNSYAIKRSAEADGTQNLFYFIDKDDNLKVQYIGEMHSYLENDGTYTHFDACNPFEILLQTQNKALFNDPVTIQNLFTVVKSYARTICPQVEHIVFKATDSPSLDNNGIFFQKTFYKDAPSDIWMEDTNISSNHVLEPTEAQVYSDSHANLDEEIQITDDQEYIIHVSDKTNKRVLFVDKPYLMKATQNEHTLELKPGWYKVKAKFSPMEDLEKKRTGISLNEKAAIIDIESAKACKNSDCY